MCLIVGEECFWSELMCSLLPVPQVLCGGQLFQRPEAGDH